MSLSNTSSQTDRRSLYSDCEDRERKVLDWDLAAFKHQRVSHFAFGIPLFLSSEKGSAPVRRKRKVKQRPSPAGKYLTLTHILKKTKNRDELWFLLALWLKQEAIREPEDFLPPAIYKRLTREARQRLQGISFTDMWYFELIRCWEPYFVRLLKDRKGFRPNTPIVEKELCDLGYEPKSVKLIMQKRWRSAVELACAWLADREVIPLKNEGQDPVSTLRNAYSRIKAGASAKPKAVGTI